MMFGHVRDHSPRMTLMLPGNNDSVVTEFVVDTGFEGELALPHSLAAQLELAGTVEGRVMVMADGQERELLVGYISLDWNGEPRITEVLVLQGNPLIGMLLLDGYHLHIEVSDGGQVLIEPL